MSEEPSNAVIVERLDNFVAVNSKEHKENRDYVLEHIAIQKDRIDDHEIRIKFLEDWQKVFVVKLSIYSAAALALGSFAATLFIKYFDKFWK